MAEQKKFTDDGKQEIDPGNRRGNKSRSQSRLTFSDAKSSYEDRREAAGQGELNPIGDIESVRQHVSYTPSAAEEEFTKPAPVVDTSNRARAVAWASKISTDGMAPSEADTRNRLLDEKVRAASAQDRAEEEDRRLNDPKVAYQHVRNTIAQEESIRRDDAEIMARPRTTAFQQSAARAGNQLEGLEEDPWTAQTRSFTPEAAPQREPLNDSRHIMEWSSRAPGRPAFRTPEDEKKPNTAGVVFNPTSDEDHDRATEEFNRDWNAWDTPEPKVVDLAAEAERRKGDGSPMGSIRGTAHQIVDAGDRLHVVHYEGNTRIGHSILPVQGGTVTDEKPDTENPGNVIRTDSVYGPGGVPVSSKATSWRVGRYVGPVEAGRVAAGDKSIRISKSFEVLHAPGDTRELDSVGQADLLAGNKALEKMKNEPIGAPDIVGSNNDARNPRELAIHAMWSQAALSDRERDSRGKRLPGVTPVTTFEVPTGVDFRGQVQRERHQVTGLPYETALDTAKQLGIVSKSGTGAKATLEYQPNKNSQAMHAWFGKTLSDAQDSWKKAHGGIDHESVYTSDKAAPTQDMTEFLTQRNGGFAPSGADLAEAYGKIEQGTLSLPKNPNYVSPEEHQNKVESTGSDINLVKWHLDREATKKQVRADIRRSAIQDALGTSFLSNILKGQ